jgi:hypothetical protein
MMVTTVSASPQAIARVLENGPPKWLCLETKISKVDDLGKQDKDRPCMLSGTHGLR